MRYLDCQKEALFLDIDGTLLDFVPYGDEVVVLPSLKEDLFSLHRKFGGALALVSGRAFFDIRSLFAPLSLPCAGSHGGELSLDGCHSVIAAPALSEKLTSDLEKAFSSVPGVSIEKKTFSFAVHYSRVPSVQPILEALLEETLKEADPSDYSLLKGHNVIEIKSRGYDKGTALAYFLSHAPFKDRRPFFLGDDTTDLPAIAYCLKHGGEAYRVGNKGERFASPQLVRAWLHDMVEAS